MIFRAARTAEAAAGHALEERLLPALSGALPVPVPLPEWRVKPGDDELPFGAIGYRKLPGRPLSTELVEDSFGEVASDLGRFLASLHSFPIAEAESLGVESEAGWRASVEMLVEMVFPLLGRALSVEELRLVERWGQEAVADEALTDYIPALRHGDLWYEQLLGDGDPVRLVGVVDWESARIGDPAKDFAAQLYLGEGFLESVIAAYGAAGGQLEPNLRHRVDRHWQLREFGGIRWSIEQDDATELEESLAKLRRGPILGRGTPETR